MARHQMPQRTKRRLIAAGIVAATIIGTGVIVGISGLASAHRSRGGPDLSVLECIPDVVDPSASQPPPSSTAPPQSSTAPADPSGEVPPEQPPAEEPPAEQPPAEEPPAEQPPAEQPPAEQPPAEQPPAEQPPAEQPPAEPAPAKPAWNQNAGLVAPAAAQPAEPAPNDESGPSNGATPEPQPQAQEVKEFTKPSCSQALGPFPEDFVNILKVRPSNLEPRRQRGASRGTFTSRCGTNQNGHRNPDNHIVSPGVVNGANHQHDYVGNLTTDNTSTDESLAAAGTTCSNGDLSAYFWPVLRVRDRDGGGAGDDAANPHNIGRIIGPSSVTLQFRGNATSKVVAMPRFIRIVTGNAKSSFQAGNPNANAKWSCTGFPGRITDKYPLCPRGSRVMRIHDFPGCWDGQNTDSANHRTHVAFADKTTGACPAGFKAIPQLRTTLTYDVPRGRIFAVDAFADSKHSPEDDHDDFHNVMPEQLMQRAVDCINRGQRC